MWVNSGDNWERVKIGPALGIQKEILSFQGLHYSACYSIEYIGDIIDLFRFKRIASM